MFCPSSQSAWVSGGVLLKKWAAGVCEGEISVAESGAIPLIRDLLDQPDPCNGAPTCLTADGNVAHMPSLQAKYGMSRY